MGKPNTLNPRSHSRRNFAMSSIQVPPDTLHPPKVVILLADEGQDPTEVAVPWKKFRDSGWEITFATENGNVAKADERLLANGLFAAFLVSRNHGLLSPASLLS